MAASSSNEITIWLQTPLKSLPLVEVRVQHGSVIDYVAVVAKARAEQAKAVEAAKNQKATEAAEKKAEAVEKKAEAAEKKAEAAEKKAEAKAKTSAKPKATAGQVVDDTTPTPREALDAETREFDKELREHNKAAKIRSVKNHYEQNPEFLEADREHIKLMREALTTVKETYTCTIQAPIKRSTLRNMAMNSSEIVELNKKGITEKFKGVKADFKNVECFNCGRMWPLRQGYKCDIRSRKWTRVES